MLRLSLSFSGDKRSARQRVRALKRSISPRLLKRALRKTRPRPKPCPVVSDELAVWLVIGLGLFCADALRQVWRWLVAFSAEQPVPPRNTLCMARQRIGPGVLIK